MIDFFHENIGEIIRQSGEHLWICAVSLSLSCLAGVALGLLLSRRPTLATAVLGVTGILQTIPSLAMLGIFIPLLGIGKTPAIVALFLYALLPIVRNTFTGLTNVDPGVRESAIAMGMSHWQLLRSVEFPLALPVIFAGIRTAAVINVGVATLCALIGAGGLGEFIFRGITLNLMPMILAGAIPASLLALLLDFSLALVEKDVRKRYLPFVVVLLAIILFPAISNINLSTKASAPSLLAGFNSEFMNREDGWPGLKEKYGFDMPTVELEITLMYEALKNEEVDVIAGFTTDGRINAYDIQVLKDDRAYFPPYYAVPLVNKESFDDFPLLEVPLLSLDGIITGDLMAFLNLQVDTHRWTVQQAADSLLRYCMDSIKVQMAPKAGTSSRKIVIGSKAFTESYILATFYSRYLEATTPYLTDLRLGFGGTKLLFDALKEGSIDLYPEYTGTAWLVFVQPDQREFETMKTSPHKVYEATREALLHEFGIFMLPSLGFNNTTALMMKRQKAEALGIYSISDLKNYLVQLEE